MRGSPGERNRMGKFLKVGLAVTAVSLAAVAAAFAAVGRSSASDTLVFGTASDPVILDGPLVSDGESLRVIDQIFEGLVGLKPGTTDDRAEARDELDGEPERPRSGTSSCARASSSRTGRRSTRPPSASTSTAGTTSPGRCRATRVTYYWNTVFGGFKHRPRAAPGPDKSLYKGCKATGKYTRQDHPQPPLVVVPRRAGADELRHREPDRAEEVPGRRGHRRRDGVFHPTGTFGTQHPIGTGPYMLKSWTGRRQARRSTREPELLGREGEARSGSSSGRSPTTRRACRRCRRVRSRATTSSTPQDIATIKGNSKLKILDRPAFNVAYVGMNQAIPPMDNIRVRQAVAYGLDRAVGRRSRSTPAAAQVADQFLPPRWSASRRRACRSTRTTRTRRRRCSSRRA